MTWKEALQEAVEERNLAEHAFAHAAAEYCDFHIYRLQAAEEKVRMIIRQARTAMGYPSIPLKATATLPQIAVAHQSGDPQERNAEDE